MSYARYIISFLLGIILGLLYPFFATWWTLVAIVMFLLVNELVGRSGFGSHWTTYRFSSYLLYTVPFICFVIGIFLGSGDIGRLLITVGKLIS